MKAYAIGLTALIISLFSPSDQLTPSWAKSHEISPSLPPGSNQMLRAPLTMADGLEVIISDVIIPPNATVPRHYHPGEEFIYMIEGSAIHVEAGKPDQVLNAGDTYVIPPEAIHEPRGGENGARAIVFRVHVAGKEERILLPPGSSTIE